MSGPAEGCLNNLTWERDSEASSLLAALESLISDAETIKRDLTEHLGQNIAWWATHPQGVVHAATKVERHLNRFFTFRRAVEIATTYADMEQNS